MLLGGSAYLVPVIDAAHDLGCDVVTCDYLPDNYGHRFADAYENISIVDREAVLAAAERLGIRGIMSFAADPGVVSAAYVAERMGLPYQVSLKAAETLQDKERFRRFLSENGFNAPRFFACGSEQQACDLFDASWGAVVVKPVDSASTKGVSLVEDPSLLAQAVRCALRQSRCGRCIVEERIDAIGGPLESDVFVIDGIVQDIVVSDQVYDERASNPIAPIGSIIPAHAGERAAALLKDVLQQISTMLEFRTGVFNVEARLTGEGDLYLMELAARGAGGNIALIQHEAGGPDLVRASVQAALGMNPELAPVALKEGVFLHDMVHAQENGLFAGIEYAPGFKERHVVRETLWIEPGTPVQAMQNSGDAFGSLLLHFASEGECRAFTENKDAGYRVAVKRR